MGQVEGRRQGPAPTATPPAPAAIPPPGPPAAQQPRSSPPPLPTGATTAPPPPRRRLGPTGAMFDPFLQGRGGPVPSAAPAPGSLPGPPAGRWRLGASPRRHGTVWGVAGMREESRRGEASPPSPTRGDKSSEPETLYFFSSSFGEAARFQASVLRR